MRRSKSLLDLKNSSKIQERVQKRIQQSKGIYNKSVNKDAFIGILALATNKKPMFDFTGLKEGLDRVIWMVMGPIIGIGLILMAVFIGMVLGY